METMRAWMAYGQERMELKEVPMPVPGLGEVLVKIRAVGICGSDMHFYKEGRIGQFVVEEPIILGHECAGEIAGIGAGVEGRRIGERVVVEPGIPCFHCHDCKTGRYHFCNDMKFMGTPPTDGCLCEYVAWPAELVHRMPESMSYEEGAMVEPFVVGMQAMRNSRIGFTDDAVVIGTGPIAMMTIQSLKVIGANKIICVGRNPWKLELAGQMGATHLIDSKEEDVKNRVKELTGGYGAMHVFEAVGSDETFWQTTELVRDGGTVTLLGLMAHDHTPMPMASVVMHGISFVPVIRYSNLFAEAIESLEYKRADIMPVLSHTFDFEQGQEAFQKVAHDNREVMKTIILM